MSTKSNATPSADPADPKATPHEKPRRRADAERSIARILDAAVEALSADPEASLAAIARQAGVVRATIYVHFPNRDELLEAVTQRAIAEVAAVIEAAEPARGSAEEALRRVVVASWQKLGQYHALVAVNTQKHSHEELHARHASALGLLVPLIQRGQDDGTFRADVPPTWHLSMLLALMHAASGELSAGRVSQAEAEPALVATVFGAMGTQTGSTR